MEPRSRAGPQSLGDKGRASRSHSARTTVRMDCTMFARDRAASNSDCSRHWKQINLIKVSLKQVWYLDKVSKNNNGVPNIVSWLIVLPDQQICQPQNNTKYDFCHCPAHNEGVKKIRTGSLGISSEVLTPGFLWG